MYFVNRDLVTRFFYVFLYRADNKVALENTNQKVTVTIGEHPTSPCQDLYLRTVSLPTPEENTECAVLQEY